MKTVTIKGEGITADLLLFRTYGVSGQALVEEFYDINPGVAALGPVLPLGTVVTIPDQPAVTSPAVAQPVTLFG